MNSNPASADSQHDVEQLDRLIDGMKHGDLSRRADDLSGPLGNSLRAFNEMLDGFANAAGALGQAAFTITRAGGELTHTTATLSSRAARQSGAMVEISRRLQALSVRCEEVAHVVEVLDDFARQTNVLSLNAALEASRAGDRGKGFAMVAEEVRKLAERSSAATRDLAAAVQAIETLAGETTRAVDEVRGIAKDLADGSGGAESLAGKLVNATRDLSRAFGRLDTHTHSDGELRSALLGQGAAFAHALQMLSPLVAATESPLSQAVRQILAALGPPVATRPQDRASER